MSKSLIFQVDSFTSTPFKGNPAGVCLLKEQLDTQAYQKIAEEMNLSETAFIRPVGENTFSIRYFTPTTEVPLCGHATLAASKVIFEKELVKNSSITFSATKNILTAHNNNGSIQMEFPPVELESCPIPPHFVEITQAAPIRMFKNSDGLYIAELINEKAILKTAPDFQAMQKENLNALLVTAPSDNSDYDFTSRFFAPGYGINEDPVTGNAHRSLCTLWSPRLNKKKLVGLQLSKRTGIVHTELMDDKIILSGEARIIIEGEILLPQPAEKQLDYVSDEL